MGALSPTPEQPRELLRQLLESGRGEELRGKLAGITGAPPELVEEAFQEACERAALPGRCRGASEDQVYQWLWHVTGTRLGKLRERANQRHELLVDWTTTDEEDEPCGAQGADVEVLRREKDREVNELARLALAHLSKPQRNVMALASRDFRVKEIAQRLGTSERSVARAKEKGYGRARDTLVGAAGGGCVEGERLVSRLAFGLARGAERGQAQLHLTECGRCATLHQRLELFHQKIAALLPIPAGPPAEPWLVERALHKATHAAGQLKQQVADAGAQTKQAAAASYSRAVEYTPLASVRPGAAAGAIAGCLALGGGAAGYCVDQGVNPVTGLVDAIQRPAQADSGPVAQKPAQPKPAQQQPPDPPPVPTTPPPAPEPAPAPPEPADAPAPAPAPATEAEPPPPPTPSDPAIEFGDPTNPGPVAPAKSAAAKPAPAPASGAGDLYGP
jgi:RNA polymerase sigma factor (sigma-70 family)